MRNLPQIYLVGGERFHLTIPRLQTVANDNDFRPMGGAA